MTYTEFKQKTDKNKHTLDNNRYKIIEQIGEGSYGVVMKGKDRQTNEVVAIKKITDSYFHMSEVIRELTILNKLNEHTHVISLKNIFRSRGFLFIVFPFVHYNMEEYIIEYYPNGLGYDLTKEFMIQVIRGIDYIHGKNVVHRDIKTENILLTTNGIVKICDLGISKMICSPLFKANLLLTPDMGTLWYQAPEMLLGVQKYGTEVDIWSLGIVFLECMSGHPVITKSSSNKQYRSIVKYLGVTIEDQKYLKKKIKNNSTAISMKYIKTNTFENVGVALRSYNPMWPTDLIDIVSRCLQFRPSRRKTTKLLLNQSYFVSGNFLKTFTNKFKNIIT